MVPNELPMLSLWHEVHHRGEVFHDPELLVLHPTSAPCGQYGWGTVFYSRAREEYKASLVKSGVPRPATFDLALMERLRMARVGGLLIAANPNSLFPGHLVLYPERQRAELAPEDLDDLFAIAGAQPDWAFIHNMEDAAASIVDWAHYQAYPVELPIAREDMRPLRSEGGVSLACSEDSYPAYALSLEGSDLTRLSAWTFRLMTVLAGGLGTGGRIPCNLIVR